MSAAYRHRRRIVADGQTGKLLTPVAGLPTGTDTAESAVLDAHAQHALLKPAYDSASRVELKPALVKAARQEELELAVCHKL